MKETAHYQYTTNIMFLSGVKGSVNGYISGPPVVDNASYQLLMERIRIIIISEIKETFYFDENILLSRL